MTDIMPENVQRRRKGIRGLFSKLFHIGAYERSHANAGPMHTITFKSRSESSESIREVAVPDELVATLVLSTAEARKGCAVAEKITYQQLAYMHNLKRAEVYIAEEADIDWELTDLDAWCSHLTY